MSVPKCMDERSIAEILIDDFELKEAHSKSVEKTYASHVTLRSTTTSRLVMTFSCGLRNGIKY